MSRIGLTLCILYLAITGLCFWASLSSSGDHKGEFVLLQLPLALQLAALDWLGFSHALPNFSWAGMYLLIGLPTLALLYGIGWGLGRLFNWLISQENSCAT